MTKLDQGSELYNNSFKDFLKINNTEMYSTYNEVTQWIWICCCWEIYYSTKNKIFKHMTSISKNVYFDVLDNTVNKYNSTVHKTIKMTPSDVTDNSYAEYNEDFN